MCKTKSSGIIEKVTKWIYFNPEATLIIIIILFALSWIFCGT